MAAATIPTSVRRLRAQIGAAESWARTADRSKRTEPGRRAAMDRFEAEIRTRFPELNDQEVNIRARHLLRAWMLRLSLKAAKSRTSKNRTGSAPPAEPIQEVPRGTSTQPSGG